MLYTNLYSIRSVCDKNSIFHTRVGNTHRQISSLSSSSGYRSEIQYWNVTLTTVRLGQESHLSIVCTVKGSNIYMACVHGSTNGTNGIPISFKVLPMVPLVIPLVPMVPLVKTVGSQYCRQSTVWAKLPTLESHMVQYGVLNFKFINFTNKHCFYQDTISI